jgi:hypothetical protein
MGLTYLLLTSTSDVTLLEVIRAGFSATSVDLEMRADAASAIELSVRRHLDSFVIDCDGVERATEFEMQVRQLQLTPETYAFSDQLRGWCERNRNRFYIPESLLDAWDIHVDFDLSSYV